MGLVPAASGSIRLGERELTALPPHEVPKAGVAYVPQGRRLFAELTVAENIEIGLMARGKGEATRDGVLDLFPLLRRTHPPAFRHAVRRRAADAGHGARALPRTGGAPARRADRGSDAVDDRENPRDRRHAARASGLDHPGRAARRGRAAGRRPRRLHRKRPQPRNGDVEALRRDPALVQRYVGVGTDCRLPDDQTSVTPASRILAFMRATEPARSMPRQAPSCTVVSKPSLTASSAE